ncbi:unnamed protein product, partial [Mycena citricolor]
MNFDIESQCCLASGREGHCTDCPNVSPCNFIHFGILDLVGRFLYLARWTTAAQMVSGLNTTSDYHAKKEQVPQ